MAVKVLNPDLGESAIVRRFRAEAMTLARLNHPGIATIYELFRSDDDLLMVMEFVRGETFDCMVERLGPLEPERAASLGAQVLDALGHAHRLGIVHRDLKPANLMLSGCGAVKIMDFGIARVVGTEHLTSDGLMMGTPAYMAPEQVLATDVDGRADLYSVGVVIYRLLSGNLPFSADTAIAMAHKQLKDPPTPLRQCGRSSRHGARTSSARWPSLPPIVFRQLKSSATRCSVAAARSCQWRCRDPWRQRCRLIIRLR